MFKKGLLLAIPLGGLCLASYITGKLIKENKVLMKWVTFGGIVLLAVSIAALRVSNAMWFLIILFLISGIGIGVGFALSRCVLFHEELKNRSEERFHPFTVRCDLSEWLLDRL